MKKNPNKKIPNSFVNPNRATKEKLLKVAKSRKLDGYSKFKDI